MLRKLVICLLLCPINIAFAGTVIISDTTLAEVAVNGGSDSPNVGTTCIKLAAPISPACSGYIAIRNNNKELVSAALAAKTSNARIWVSFYDQQPVQHCSDIVNTSCVVSSIMLK